MFTLWRPLSCDRRKWSRRLPAHFPPGRCTAALAALLLAGCQTLAPPPPSEPSAPILSDWRRVLRASDVARLEAIPQTWMAALAAARRGGFSARIATDGRLLAPDAALGRAAPAPGPYRCRLVRLGAPRRAFTAFAPYFCHVGDEGELLSLTKQTGAERPGGYLWEDGGRRMVFAGAIARGAENAQPAYGDRVDADLVGIVERIGPFRYRLVMPRAAGVATLDVLEMVAVVPGG